MQLLLSKDKDKFCILKQESTKPLAAWWRSFGYLAALNIKDEYEIQCPAGHLPCPAGQGKAGQGTNSQICIFFSRRGQGRIEKYCPVDTSAPDSTREHRKCWEIWMSWESTDMGQQLNNICLQCATLRLTNTDSSRKLLPFEMKCYRRIWRINWKDMVQNDDIRIKKSPRRNPL